MPKMDGIAAIKAIKKETPQARILVLTSFADEEKVFAAIKAGALGYVLKDASPQDLIQAIGDVHQGNSPLDPAIARKLIQEMNQPSKLPLTADPLTEREIQVLELIAQGQSNQEIAKELFVSVRTVAAHMGRILDKLHLANRTQAATRKPHQASVPTPKLAQSSILFTKTEFFDYHQGGETTSVQGCPAKLGPNGSIWREKEARL